MLAESFLQTKCCQMMEVNCVNVQMYFKILKLRSIRLLMYVCTYMYVLVD